MNQSGPTIAGNRVTMIVAAVGCLFLSGIGVWWLLGSHDLVEEPAMIGNGDLLPPGSPPVTAFNKTSGRAIQAGVIATIPSTQAVDTALTRTTPPAPPVSVPVNPDELPQQIQQRSNAGQQRLVSASQSLPALIGDTKSFANELGKLAKTFPSAATAPSYRRCYTESPLWAAVLEWSRLLAEASPAANIPFTPQSAHRFIERGDKLDACFAIEPYTSQYAYMKVSALRVASRLDFADKPIHQALEAYLDGELISQLDCLDELGGTRYYLKTGSALDLTAPTHVAFNYIIDNKLNTKRQRAERTKFRQKNRLAPHCELAKLIRAKLNTATDITGQAWNDVFSDILMSTLQFRDANPLMQLEIYSFALQVATKGSLDFEISHAAHSKAIQQASFIDHTAKWFDPKDQAGMTANNQAAALLRQLLILPVDKTAHSRLSPTTFGPLNLTWFGYLQKTQDNRWQVVASDRKNHPLNFFMVTHDTPQMRLQPIKATSDGFIEVQEGKNDLLEGRPIFFESSQEKHP